MIERWKVVWVCAAIAVGMAVRVLAQEGSSDKGSETKELSAEEIVKKAYHVAYYQGKDGVARVKMTITDRKLQTVEKEFTILRRNQDEKNQEQNFYVYLQKPADERGTALLVHKRLGKDDDRWLFLPAQDVVKPIAASDERTRFMGSHYFYEDVSGRGVDEDVHERTEATGTFYVIKNTPKNPGAVEFDSFKMWIRKDTFIPVQVAFEKNGEVYRTSKVLKVEDIQGYKTVTKAQMTDEHIGGSTVLEYSDVRYDTGLPEDIFTERYLRNPPPQCIESKQTIAPVYEPVGQ